MCGPTSKSDIDIETQQPIEDVESGSEDIKDMDESVGSASASHDEDYMHNNGCGRGVVKDFKRTIGTWWIKEMTNFNQKTIAVSFFLFFACISPAITFGAVYSKTTNNYIGAVEMILATAWAGIFYALVGGQPIMINGGTGPVLAFVGVLYGLAESWNIPFLSVFAWTGLWTALYLFIFAFVDLNRLLHYATRFTDEVFSLLISVIFIVDALGSPFAAVGLYYYFVPTHKSHDAFEDEEDYSYWASALLSVILCLGTTIMAFVFRGIKTSQFCCNPSTRAIVADFAVTGSVVLWTVLDNTAFRDVKTERLNVPDTFEPTFQCCDSSCSTFFPDDCQDQAEAWGPRPWFVNLFDLNGKTWLPFVAAGPALLAVTVCFLDNGITWHLINHPSHKITHGTAYNWDTVIMAIITVVNSLIGIPWLTGATVRSLNHLHALAEKTKGGKFLHVQETRLTHLLIHVLVLCCIFALQVLKIIPIPVLYGVFLFMGLASLGTNQFFQRFLMYFKQPKLYKNTDAYTRHVPVKRMHLFTLCQVATFALLLIVKSIKAIAIVFPIVIAACIPIRCFLLPRIFTKDELLLLDGDDKGIEDWLESHNFDKEVEHDPEMDLAASLHMIPDTIVENPNL